MTPALRVFRSLQEAEASFGPCALTIGNFDGVHLGHLVLLHRVRDLARELHVKAAVLTFDPHPAKVVAPEKAPKLLTSCEQRCTLFAQAGIDEVLILPFDRTFSELSPTAFVEQVLVRTLRTKAVVVGENFRFGYKHQGDTALLAQLGREHDFLVEALSSVTERGRVVSSTEIRQAVKSGKIVRAGRMLGRPFSLDGEVVKGHGIGSTQTVPTLNLQARSEVMPATGVYVTRTFDLDGPRIWRSITNVGYRPTFDGDSLTVETFLLDSLTGDPPQSIRVEFLHYVRPERKFESAEALKQQILRDVGRAKTYFRRRQAAREVIPLTTSEISDPEILQT